MNIEQIYTNCLAQGAYFTHSEDEAAVIAPLRDVDHYINLARKTGTKIKYIFETHFHTDFVSGHLELARETGAEVVFGPNAVTRFSSYTGQDQEAFELGKLKIKLRHTPGHTGESSCYLLLDETGREMAIFTGDTLFIGDVGHPDLAQAPVDGLTQEKLAGMLYDSSRQHIVPLPDHLIVFPAHGAGSACGKKLSKATSDLLGNQKQTNYALNLDPTRDQFIADVTSGLSPSPAYFPMNVKLNSQGSISMKEVYQQAYIRLARWNFA